MKHSMYFLSQPIVHTWSEDGMNIPKYILKKIISYFESDIPYYFDGIVTSMVK